MVSKDEWKENSYRSYEVEDLDATWNLVQFVTESTFNDLPEDVIEKAKLQILDCIGVTLAGLNHSISGIIEQYLKTVGGKRQATVIGLGLKAPCPDVAWANGSLGHALDFDDNSIDLPAAIHQTVTTLPAAMSVGEYRNVNGREMLLALVLGIEVGSKVDRAMGGHLRAWHGTGTFGTLASAVAAGKLLELSSEELEFALGAAMSMAAGLTVNFGTMMKPLHAGQASRNGVLAAMLVKGGLNSAKGVLEGKDGFAAVMGVHFDPEYLVRHLGNPWEIEDPGIHLKMYPSCMATHAALDAALKIEREYKPNPDEVSSVEVRSKKDLSDALIYNEPRTALEGKFSMQFCIAIALLRGQATLEEFIDEEVRNTRIMKLMEKVKLLHDSKMEGRGVWSTHVKVAMADGRVCEEMVEYPKGSKMKPMSLHEVKEKFRGCAGGVLPQNRIDELMDIILRLEDIDDISQLLRCSMRP